MLLLKILLLAIVLLITVDHSVMILITALHNLVRTEELVNLLGTHITVVALMDLQVLTVIM